MGLFKWFKSTKKNDMVISIKEHTLSDEQLKNGSDYYKRHKIFIERCVKVEVHTYPPTDNEDKSNPRLWKPAHWKWFLKYNKIK